MLEEGTVELRPEVQSASKGCEAVVVSVVPADCRVFESMSRSKGQGSTEAVVICLHHKAR